jgi:hypothetical protein
MHNISRYIKDNGESCTRLYRKYKLQTDINEFVNLVDTNYPLSTYEFYKKFPTPNGGYFLNTYELPKEICNIISDSIGYPIHDYAFLWNWACITTELLAHIDDYESANGGKNKEHEISDFHKVVYTESVKPLNLIVALENWTRTDIYNPNSQVWESVTYGPGEILLFDNEKYLHRATVLHNPHNVPKRSLNCYVDRSILEKYDDFFENISFDGYQKNKKAKLIK